jgi:hypothetical protein
MLPIQPIGERTAVTQLYGAASAPAVAAPAPPGVAVDVSPFGQLLGTLALAQRRLEELAAAGTDPGTDIARLGIAAGELTEAFNLGRNLPLPGQPALPARLTDAFAAQQAALAQAGIALADDGRLEVDSGRLLAAFERNRQAILDTLTQTAARFAAAGETAVPTAAVAEARVPDAPPPPPEPTAAAVAGASASQASARPREVADEPVAAAEAQAASRQAEAVTEQAVQLRRQQAAQAEAAHADVARADAQRLADLQVSASLAEASQAALTREARRAAYRLEVAREVASVQAAVQDDSATQDGRLSEARAAALRQLTSSEAEDLAAQSLADRLARQRDAAPALSAEEQDTQERLMAVRRAAGGTPSVTPERTVRAADSAIGIDSAPQPDADVTRDNAQPAASRPAPPNAADPALAAAIAAQRLAGGIPGGGTGAAPPPRTQLIAPVRPVGAVTAAEGSRTKPRGGT